MEKELEKDTEKELPKKRHNHFIPTRVRRGKEVSNYSRDDLSAIFGYTEEKTSLPPSPPTETTTDIITQTSKTSMNDYFSQKMASKRGNGT